MRPDVGVERLWALPFLGEGTRSDRGDMGNGSTPPCMGDHETARRCDDDEREAVGEIQHGGNTRHVDLHRVPSIKHLGCNAPDVDHLGNARDLRAMHLVRHDERSGIRPDGFEDRAPVLRHAPRIIIYMPTRVERRIRSFTCATRTTRERDAHTARFEQCIIGQQGNPRKIAGLKHGHWKSCHGKSPVHATIGCLSFPIKTMRSRGSASTRAVFLAANQS